MEPSLSRLLIHEQVLIRKSPQYGQYYITPAQPASEGPRPVLLGRILTLPPQHRTSPRDRTASRPRLAARSTAQVALNLFTRAIAFGAAASRGRDGSRSGGSVKMRPLRWFVQLDTL